MAVKFCRICGPLPVLIGRGDLRCLLGEVLAGAQLTHPTSYPNPRLSPSDTSYYVSSRKRRNVCSVASCDCDRNAFSPRWFTCYEGIILAPLKYVPPKRQAWWQRNRPVRMIDSRLLCVACLTVCVVHWVGTISKCCT